MAVVAPRAPMRVLKDQKLQNWNLTESTAPAVAAFANSTEDVCAVVADKAAYPSPVLAVGSMHSVNACVSNNGTILNVAGAWAQLESPHVPGCWRAPGTAERLLHAHCAAQA